jgi:hypothetical protein
MVKAVAESLPGTSGSGICVEFRAIAFGFLKGHGFSRAASYAKNSRALAPEGM